MLYSQTVHVVTRLFLSASDCSSNGYSECKAFAGNDDAHELFARWREEELACRRESGCAYEVYSDSSEKFHCAWDGGQESAIIMHCEKNIIQ